MTVIQQQSRLSAIARNCITENTIVSFVHLHQETGKL